jgi:hypothetical protein
MSEVGLLKEAKNKDKNGKTVLTIEVTNDITLKKGDVIFLNDPKDYLNFIVKSEKSSDKQRAWAEGQLEGFETGKLGFIKKRLQLAKRKEN